MNVVAYMAEFLQSSRKRLRYGELSRAPFHLLRLEWRPEALECDWLMRRADPWDETLPAGIAQEHETQQALHDAMNLRNLVFRCFSNADRAVLRMFREGERGEFHEVMTGHVSRANEIYTRVPSVAMRAKLCGFRFNLVQGVLERHSQSQ